MTAPLYSASAFSTPVLAALNHVLDQADWARGRLQPFAGRSVRIAMLPFAITFSIGSNGHLTSSDGTPDLDIVLPPDTPLLAMQGNDRVMQVAQVNGPADLADALSFVLRNLRWDIEEDLSRVVGDVVARRMVATLDAFAGWQRQAARNLADNVGEYLVEEKQTLVKASEMTSFASEAEQLRCDLAAIEARIERLSR